jgi:hypothetical protein
MSVGARRSKPYVRPATREDCLSLAPNLREADLQELQHAVGLPAREVLLIGYHTADHFYAAVWEDEVVALFGVNGVPGVVGFPWMLASGALTGIRKSFLRECSGVVQGMLREYGTLENHVWAKNEVHIQWLRWLGFTVESAVPFGIDGEPFHRFYMKE